MALAYDTSEHSAGGNSITYQGSELVVGKSVLKSTSKGRAHDARY